MSPRNSVNLKKNESKKITSRTIIIKVLKKIEKRKSLKLSEKDTLHTQWNTDKNYNRFLGTNYKHIIQWNNIFKISKRKAINLGF